MLLPPEWLQKLVLRIFNPLLLQNHNYSRFAHRGHGVIVPSKEQKVETFDHI